MSRDRAKARFDRAYHHARAVARDDCSTGSPIANACLWTTGYELPYSVMPDGRALAWLLHSYVTIEKVWYPPLQRWVERSEAGRPVTGMPLYNTVRRLTETRALRYPRLPLP